MPDENNAQPTPQPAQQEAQPQFALQRIYLKDASLEMPHSPDVFLLKEPPGVNIQIAVDQVPLQNDNYEIVVRATLTAKATMDGEEKTAFVVECKQAGIFLAKGIPPQALPMLLGITCPATVYPYLRSNVTDLMTRACLPPVYLAEVNFEALFAQRMQQQAEAQKKANGEANPAPAPASETPQ